MDATRREALKAATGVVIGGSVAGCLEFVGASPSTGKEAAAAVQLSSDINPALNPDQHADQFDDLSVSSKISALIQSARNQSTAFTIPERHVLRDIEVRTDGWETESPTSIFSGSVSLGENVTVNREVVV